MSSRSSHVMTDAERYRKALERIVSGDVPEPRSSVAEQRKLAGLPLLPEHDGEVALDHERAVYARYAQHVLEGGDPEVGDSEYV